MNKIQIRILTPRERTSRSTLIAAPCTLLAGSYEGVHRVLNDSVYPPTYLSKPGVDGQKGLRLKFNNSRQSLTIDTSKPFSARHFEYSTEYSMYIPCRQSATWLADSRLRG
eukprot:6126696-Pyramimonas_sp.AAC.2